MKRAFKLGDLVVARTKGMEYVTGTIRRTTRASKSSDWNTRSTRPLR